MPIATKLSRKLQEVFGTEAADAMVDWMQNVEGARAELRDLNDLSFARFDTRLGERIATLDAKLDRSVARLDARIDRLGAELDAKIERVAADLTARMDVGFARIDATLAKQRAELFRWAAMFWIGSLVAIVAAMAALSH